MLTDLREKGNRSWGAGLGGVRERARERLVAPTRIKPAAEVCALPGVRTCSFLVCGTTLRPAEPPARVTVSAF